MENDICNICLENIENEFCILNCYCKKSFFHNKCINELIKFNFTEHKQFSCPLCRYIFPTKRTFNKYISSTTSTPSTISTTFSVFTINYNILRIMSGYGALSYYS